MNKIIHAWNFSNIRLNIAGVGNGSLFQPFLIKIQDMVNFMNFSKYQSLQILKAR
ncbi:hypothetical protein [Nitrosopumilus oxyclinae]|uniref:hypothetical protein n=1 Tax=Nitrosopumilus oxyclinae TaxID=1959104 RepID=UPI0015CD6FCB|nr:hypothetical protein [Nitrosopumilus oxyclinae]